MTNPGEYTQVPPVGGTTRLISTFRELTIQDGAAKYEELADGIELLLDGNWSRDKETEANDEMHYPYKVFKRAGAEGRPGVRLFLLTKSRDVYVANMVPVDVGEISTGEYNATLKDFADHYAQPAADAQPTLLAIPRY